VSHPYWPTFLQHPDPDGLSPIEQAALRPLRARYMVMTNAPIILNEGTPLREPFSMDLAVAWAERLAAEELP